MIITLRGEPIAQVVPTPPEERERDWIGFAEDTGRIKGDIPSPTGEQWEVMENIFQSKP